MEARKERTVWEMTTTREEFEAWAKDRGHFLSRHPVEGYLNAQTDAAWVAWQAAHLAGQRAMRDQAETACRTVKVHVDGYHQYTAHKVRGESSLAVQRLMEVKP